MPGLRIRELAVAAIIGLTWPLQVSAIAKCYGIDGSDVDSSFVPCNPDSEVSACCPSNKQNGDICLTSGLCYAQAEGYQGLMYSNGCTDKTGKSKDCPHICPDSTDDWAGGKPVASWNVLQCNATTFCCRQSTDGSSCCNDASKIVNDFTPGTLVLASLTASGATATVTSTVTAACKASGSSSASTESCPKDNSAVVGGAVGGVLGAALLGALGAVAMLLKRRRNEHVAATEPHYEATALQYQDPQKYSSPQTPPSAELDEPIHRHEMS